MRSNYTADYEQKKEGKIENIRISYIACIQFCQRIKCAIIISIQLGEWVVCNFNDAEIYHLKTFLGSRNKKKKNNDQMLWQGNAISENHLNVNLCQYFLFIFYNVFGWYSIYCLRFPISRSFGSFIHHCFYRTNSLKKNFSYIIALVHTAWTHQFYFMF